MGTESWHEGGKRYDFTRQNDPNVPGRNKLPATCHRCGLKVPAGGGKLVQVGWDRRWETVHLSDCQAP